jgi:hypothetical protein
MVVVVIELKLLNVKKSSPVSVAASVVALKEKRTSMKLIIIHFHSYYSDRGTCVKCYLSCDTCSGPRRDQCVTCPKDWKLAGGECHPECPEGYFKTEFGCQRCHHYCKTCDGE